MFEVNGVKLEYDAFDADTVEKYVAGKKAVAKAMENLKGKEAGVMVRGQCKAVKTFFDSVFGEGKGVEVCGQKDNLRVCAESYAAMLREDNKQGAEFAQNNTFNDLFEVK